MNSWKMKNDKWQLTNGKWNIAERQQGTILVTLLILAATFIIIIYSLLAVISTQFDFSFRNVAGDQAFHIAEAGIYYYRWHLLQAPGDYQDGTGQAGPYVHDYYDPQGTLIGQFSLEITPPDPGSYSVLIRSTAWTSRYPSIRRTVSARLGSATFANYTMLNNESLWIGEGVTVNGKIHSNSGIRQDGINTSTVESSRATYICDKDTGCDPDEVKPGVWGSGEDSTLWQFPVPSIDFGALAFDFGRLRTEAQNNGVYLGPSGYYGYNLVFKSDGTVDIFIVTDAQGYVGWDSETGCANRRERIREQTLQGTYNLSDNPIIFLEDMVWVSGTVNGQATVVAARFPLDTYNTNIWIPDNLVYADKNSDDVLGVIAQNDIYFARDIPEVFEINAALMAVNGHVIRHGFFWFCGEHSNAVRLNLTIFGAIISNKKAYWNFGTKPDSGFRDRTAAITFDPQLADDPPPYYPQLGGLNFIQWQN
jgi:hypothetical protein